MKILFISSAQQPDYLCDSLYHGLKSRYGEDVETINDMWYMYDTLLERERGFLYGKGFTLYGLLDSQIKNSPSIKDIKLRISEHYYSYIIYGSIQQCKLLLDTVIGTYAREKIIFLDGEDRTSILTNLTDKGFYFKRELLTKQINVFPISFAIPEEKISAAVSAKKRDWAINYPGRLNTYIHNTEISYYNDYQTSRYAVTFKKEGWDCLRHYEIMANSCLPYFKDLQGCPQTILANFPKDLLLEINQTIESNTSLTAQQYDSYTNKLLEFVRKELTTEALVDYVIRTAKNSKIQPTNRKSYQPEQECNDALFKAAYFDQILRSADVLSPVIIHYGLSTVQELKFLRAPSLSLYSDSMFLSATHYKWPDNIQFKEYKGQLEEIGSPDLIILDMTLSYQEDLLKYLQSMIRIMGPETKMVLVVPNYKSLATLLGILKNDLKFGRLILSNKSQVNYFSEKSLTRLLRSYNLEYRNLLPFDFDRSNRIKRILNGIKRLKGITGRKLIVETYLKHE